MTGKNTPLVVIVAAVLIGGISCQSPVALDKPNVTGTAISSGLALQLTWTGVTGAESYEIKTDDSTHNTADTVFRITTPTATIEVRAVSGSTKSDPATIECRVVETSSVVLYGISDPDPNHPSGLAFTDSGSVLTLPLDNANKESIDFVCDDEDVPPVGLVNAGSYGWPQNARLNTLKEAHADYDSLDLASEGGYTDLLVIAPDSVYAFWLSDSTAWSTDDHFGKLKVVAIDDVGGSKKVTLNVACQPIGGLRWLVK